MWGQCIVRNFLCFPSFQKLDNLNPKEDREKSAIFSNFYLRKTLLQEDTDTGWMNEYDLLSWLSFCRCQNFSWSCQTHLKPDCQRFASFLYFHHCIWRATFQNNWWWGRNWGNVKFFPKHVHLKNILKQFSFMQGRKALLGVCFCIG